MDIKAGSADVSVSFAAWTTATGAAVTVTSATAGLSLWYRRGGIGAKTAISPSDLALLTTAHTDGGILVIEGAEHRLDLPDAAVAAGVSFVEWGGTATGITIDGGRAELIGQANTATDTTHVGGTQQTAGDIITAMANLDTQLSGISGYVDCLPASLNDLSSAQVQAASAAALTAWGKTGFALAANGLDLVIPADPSTVPVPGTTSIVGWIGYFGAWSVNEINQTSAQTTLRNSADDADLATHATADDGTTFSSGAAS